jgi:hypothetical protein
VLYINCLIVVFLCRLVAEPQRSLGAHASPSRIRSPDPKVMVESLVKDRMATREGE